MSDHPKIRTENFFPPIPVRQFVRQFDWSAVFEDFEPGGPVGYGASEQAAIADLLEIWRDDNGQFGVGA